MNNAMPVADTDTQPGEITTILSDRVMIPIACDHCGHETSISIERLKQQTILCEHCSHVRHFSTTELRLLRLLLAQAGYHFAL